MIEAIKAAIQAFIITLVLIIIVIGFNEVQADQFITMPNGSTCYQQANGQMYGCSTPSRAPVQQPTKRQQFQQEQAVRQNRNGRQTTPTCYYTAYGVQCR